MSAAGAAIRTYLLERSRVVAVNDPERNYHVFYQVRLPACLETHAKRWRWNRWALLWGCRHPLACHLTLLAVTTRVLQLCDGASDAERAALRLKPAKQFRYLSQSNCFDLRGVSNAEEYRRTRRSMSVVGIPEPEQVRTLAFSAACA